MSELSARRKVSCWRVDWRAVWDDFGNWLIREA